MLTELAKYDCRIYAVDINQAELEKTCLALESYTALIRPYICDLSKQTEIDSLFESVLKNYGSIDLFFANAGFAYFEALGKADWQHIEKIYQVNVFSSIYTALKMREINQDRPFRVVVTASGMAKFGLPGYALYASTKAALDNFADTYRLELDDPTALTLVYPIATRTHFFETANHAPQAWPSQSPQQVAEAVVQGVLDDRNSIFPSRIFWWIWRIGATFPFIYRLEQQIEKRKFKGWVDQKRLSSGF